MVISDTSFKILSESNELILGNIFENTYLFNKITKNEIHLGTFYGDPNCGLISKDSNWCIAAGDVLIIWQNHNSIVKIEDDELNSIINARQIAPFEIELLVDPWATHSSIWKLNIQTLERVKIKPLPPKADIYSEDVEW